MARGDTRERILSTALAMFNREGEGHVSTNHIADEMDISPGNLYYHFRNKEQIVGELFDRFRSRIEILLMAPSERRMDLEDTWLFLHLVFEAIWDYRFIYYNLVDLAQRNRSLRIHINHILRQKHEAAHHVLAGLRQAGVLEGSDRELESAALNIACLATSWLNFQSIRQGQEQVDDLAEAVYQTLSLVAPMLRQPERAELEVLAQQYL